ncbi:MAG TPA: PadR family transcriptional regulator [Actinomycetota bacterium]|nr:PadR family transcriptional regulator [Actinomycetota bacterium]
MEGKLRTTSYAILGLLTFGPMSGYDVLKLAERSIGHFWSPAKSHVYTELRRLARLGLASEQRVQQEQRPNKRVYAITEEGRSALELWLSEGAYEPDQVRSSFTVRMFFGGLVPRSSIIAQVEELRRRAERTLDELRATESEIRDDEGLFFPYLTLKAGLAHSEAEIRWADETLEALREREDA